MGLIRINSESVKFAHDFKATPDVVVLKSGYYDSLESLLATFKEPTIEAELDFSPTMVADHPVFVIPTGGLYGLDSSTIFRAKLEEYVKSGGTLIVFSQQRGYEFKALPGGELGGYGWQEDMSCITNSVEIDQYHQVLASQNTSPSNISVDGFFTSWPKDSQILLRRTKNGMPAALIYPYGQGRVIATTSYADWAYGMSQASASEKAFVRDLISWAKNPIEIADFRPGQTIRITENVKNVTDKPATTVELKLLSPDRNKIHSESHALSLSPGETKQLDFVHTAPTFLGIYFVDYLLKDSGGNVVQPQAEGERFAVSNPPAGTISLPEVSLSIQSDADRYAIGSNATFTFNAWNRSSTTKNITVWYNFLYSYLATGSPIYGNAFMFHPGLIGNLKQTIPVAPNNWNYFTVTVPVVSTSFGFERIFADYYDENNTYLGSASHAFYIVNPSVDLKIVSDKPRYERGENVDLTLDLTNKKDGSTDTQVNLSVSDPQNMTVFQKGFSLTLPANGTASQTLSFPLSPSSEFGVYLVRGEAYSGGQKISSGASSFELSPVLLEIVPQLPSLLRSNAINTVSFTLRNFGHSNSVGAVLKVDLISPQNVTIFSSSQTFSLLSSQSTLLGFDVPIPSIEFGNYRLVYRLDYEGRPLKGEAVFPSSVDMKASFDKNAYKIRDNLSFNLSVLNNGKFVEDVLVDVSVPNLGFTDSKSISLNPGQSTSFPYSILIPTTLSPGQHNVLVTARKGMSQQTKTFSFSLLDLKLDLSLDRILYAAGEIISVNLENRGGIDSNYDYSVKLIDSKGFTLYQGSTQGLILAGERKSLDFTIPGQATGGTYNLYADVKDLNSGKISHLGKVLQLNGISATLTSKTDKQSYLASENVTALSSISNQNLAISNGNLNLKVLSGPSREGVQFIKQWGQFGALDRLSGIAVDNSGNLYVVDTGNNRVEKFDTSGNFISRWGSLGNGDGQFNFPSRIAADPFGSVYVADTQNNRIQKFDSNGNFLLKWGRYGSLNGQFNNPYDVAVDANGYVYVADSWNHRIQKFDSNGNFVSSWGSLGSLDGQFYYPFGIAVDRAGYVYVADSNANRIQKFDLNGNFLLKWSVLYPTSLASLRTDTTGHVYVAVTYLTQARIEKYDSSGNFILSWGSKGQGDGQFDMPSGIATDSLGYVYVSETTNRRVQKFDSNGLFVTKWPGLGPGNGNFNQPSGVATDSAGNLYVADRENARIQKFDSNGNFLTSWGTFGEENGQFVYPSDVALDSNDNVYVADQSRIQKFDSNGNFILRWGSYGLGAGQFMFPYGITVDRSGNVYVADTNNHRVQKFDSFGNFLTSWGSRGSLNGQFISPRGISVDSSGNVYVTDSGNNRIQKFDANGNFLLKWALSQVYGVEVDSSDNVYVTADSMVFKYDSNGALLTKWGSQGSGDGQFSNPYGIATDRFGSLYVADTGNNRIQKFSLGTGQRQVVFQKDIPINLAANTVSDITTAIGSLIATGKLYLESTLSSSTGQVVSQDSYPFYIFPSNITMTMTTDKKVYKPGETINITGEVKNLSALPLLGKNILVTADGVLVYTETINLDASHSRLFTATMIASKNFTLEGSFAGVNLSDLIEVSAPALDITVDSPSAAPRTGFDLDTTLKNTSTVDTSVIISYQPLAVTENVTVPAGETRLIKKAVTISQDTTFTIVVSGDVSKTVTKQVLLGEKARVDLFPGTIYQEGQVAVPYSAQNTGTLDSTFDIAFSLNGQAIQTKKVSVSAGVRLDDTLYLGSLTKGTYTLSFTSSFGSGTKSFKVARLDDIDMNVSASVSDSQVPVSAVLENVGFSNFSGTLKAEASFDRKEVDVSLLVGQINTYRVSLNGQAVKPGIYDVRISLLNSSGNVIREAVKQIEIKAPAFEVVSAPTSPSFTIGQRGSLVFGIKNTGNVSGEASLTLDLPGVWQETRASWISPGETKEIAFSVPIPEDLEERDYPAIYTIGSQAREFTYHVSGIKLSVDANLNRALYNPGDKAIFTINVTNQATAQNLYAKVQYQDYEESKHFTLTTTSAVSFDIPVKSGQQRLSYGVYTESGRAIYLNSTYVRVKEDVITLTPDKYLYNAGDVVSVSVDTAQSGTLKVFAPNYIEDIIVSGPTSFSFTLPQEFRSGTYTIDYTFQTTSGSVPIDIKGYSARVIEAGLNKQTYSSQDTIQASLKVISDQAFVARIKGWVYDESGKSQQIIDVSRSFALGENRIQVQGTFTTKMPGTHRFVYGIYKEGTTLLLVSGQEAFDVEGVSLISIATSRVDYPYITEPVQVLLSGYGNTMAQVELYLDGSLVHTQTASFSGLTNLVVPLGTVSPGVHTLKARLVNGALSSEKEAKFVFGSSLPDLGYNQKVCKKGLGGGILQDNKKLLKEGGTAYGKGYHDSERRVNTRV